MAEKQTNKQRLKEITDSIEANIQELFQSERYWVLSRIELNALADCSIHFLDLS